MADIPVNKLLSGAEVTITKLDLSGGPHAFTFVDHNQKLIVENGEVGSVTVNILGDGVTTINCPGIGPVDTSSGFNFVVPAGDSISLHTSGRKGYLGSGGNAVVATITGATGLALGWIEE